MNNIRYIKPKARKPYSSETLRFSLMQRYTSRQSYVLLQHDFPLSSLSVLKKLASGGIEPIKAIQLLREEGKMNSDCVLILDEMYLQKSSEYHGGMYVGLDGDGKFYKGILCFMIVGLKESIPYVIKACPETTITGELVYEQIVEILSTLKSAGFNVRAIISDNHSTNVWIFKINQYFWNYY